MLNLVNPSAFAVHPAIERCLQAGRAAHAEALAQEKSSDQPPSDQPEARFRDAYMQAMPDLSSRENVCSFIACVTYGMVGDIIHREAARSYLYAAQVALSAVPRAAAGHKATAA